MNHAAMVRNVVAGLQELLQQDKSLIETTATASITHEHVANMVQSSRQQLAAQLQHMRTMIQVMKLQYDVLPQPTQQYYGSHENYGGNNNYRGRGGCGV